jgi:tetratricopeptide (TPR) repeat protein
MSVFARRSFVVVLSAFVAAAAVGAPRWDTSEYPVSTQRRFEEAERLFMAGDHDASFALYTVLTRERPELSPAHIGLAASASRLGKHEEASVAYLAAAALLPGDPTIEGELADSYRDAKRLDEAERWYHEALSHAGGHADSAKWHVGLGLVDSSAGRFRGAAAHYRDALAANPLQTIATHNLGVALLKLNDLDAADAAFAAALSADKTNARAVFARGQIAGRRGDRKAASEYYRRACEMLPDEPTFHHARARVLRRLGDDAEAETALRRYRATKAALYRAKGREFMSRKLWVDALAHLTKAVETDPEDIDSLTDRAYCLLRKGESELAVLEYERVLAVRPDATQAAIRLATALDHLGRHVESEARLLDAITRDPGVPATYRQLASTRRARGDLVGSEAAFTMGIAHNDKWAPGYWWRGGVRRDVGDEAGAEADFRMAIQLTPDAPFPRESLARLLLETGGDLDEARAHAESAVRKTPSPQHRATLALVYYALGLVHDATREIERAYISAPELERVVGVRRRIRAGGTP